MADTLDDYDLPADDTELRSATRQALDAEANLQRAGMIRPNIRTPDPAKLVGNDSRSEQLLNLIEQHPQLANQLKVSEGTQLDDDHYSLKIAQNGRATQTLLMTSEQLERLGSLVEIPELQGTFLSEAQEQAAPEPQEIDTPEPQEVAAAEPEEIDTPEPEEIDTPTAEEIAASPAAEPQVQLPVITGEAMQNWLTDLQAEGATVRFDSINAQEGYGGYRFEVTTKEGVTRKGDFALDSAAVSALSDAGNDPIVKAKLKLDILQPDQPAEKPPEAAKVAEPTPTITSGFATPVSFSAELEGAPGHISHGFGDAVSVGDIEAKPPEAAPEQATSAKDLRTEIYANIGNKELQAAIDKKLGGDDGKFDDKDLNKLQTASAQDMASIIASFKHSGVTGGEKAETVSAPTGPSFVEKQLAGGMAI